MNDNFLTELKIDDVVCTVGRENYDIDIYIIKRLTKTFIICNYFQRNLESELKFNRKTGRRIGSDCWSTHRCLEEFDVKKKHIIQQRRLTVWFRNLNISINEENYEFFINIYKQIKDYEKEK